MTDIAILGLGAMGSTLARLLIGKGHAVHVWNRTASRTRPLETIGARAHAGPAGAAAAAAIVVICVHDYAATDQILATPGVAEAIAGKTLIQLTTGSPQDARDGLAWAEAHGARYLDGAIQVAPSQMGLPDTTILISGDEAALAETREVLAAFGGNAVHLGPSIAAAAAMDLATLSFVYGAVGGFLQGALFAEAEGLDLGRYGEIVRAMAPSYGDFLAFEADAIRRDDFTIAESPLEISVLATARIEQAAKEAGIATALPSLMADLFRRAEAAGYAREEAAALIKVMRAEGRPADHAPAP